MVMKIDYKSIRNSIYNTLITDDRFKVGENTAYVRQVIKQRWIPSPPLPVVMIYLENKPTEEHRAIGYSPFPILVYTIKTILQLPPNENEIPDALLTEIGKSSIRTPEDADDAIEVITDAIEEVIRGDNVTLKANRYLNNDQIKVALPISTNFGFIKGENTYYIFSEIQLRIDMRLNDV